LFERRPLLVDAPGVAGIAAADDLVDEAPPGSEIVEVARGAQPSALLRWPWALSIEPFSCDTPGLLRVALPRQNCSRNIDHCGI
jgi:hypothetical protein